MKNKNVGFLIIGVAVVIVIIILIFNTALKDIISATCSHGPSCGMYDSLRIQTWISLVIVGLVLVVGFFLIFSKPEEKIVIRKVKERVRKKKIDLSGLDKNEKKVVRLLQEDDGVVFQRDLMERLEIGKVGMTRLLDKLEAKQFIERKRRGMNNIVVLKNGK